MVSEFFLTQEHNDSKYKMEDLTVAACHYDVLTQILPDLDIQGK